jgi:hypothetical protein
MRGKGPVLAIAFAAAMLGAGPAQAHNDWALPLLGGAVGGYALKSVLGSGEAKSQPHQAHTAPPPSAPAPADSTASVEQRLHQLDTLAANGYITKQEYQQRRQAILDGI